MMKRRKYYELGKAKDAEKKKENWQRKGEMKAKVI
jgi:hypothetical protein